jgi:serine-type D-Ala-D-Ala carboxypeptidase/endopeptidase
MNLSFLRFVARLVVLSGFLLVVGTTILAQSNLSTLDGVWLGTLFAGPQTLRLQFHLQATATGAQNCALDSIDQRSFGIVCTNLTMNGDVVSIDVPAVGGGWSGKISEDGKTLTGTWKQGANNLPLVLTREATAIQPPATPAAVFDAAIPAAGVADLKPVLDADLASTLKVGALAPETHGGITIGVVQHGVRRIFSYGTAAPDSVFEIGSISKTFTGLILAQMVEQGTVRLNEPVRDLLPKGTVSKPASGGEITLLDLSDQHSGLPRLPTNMHPADPRDPYADYNETLLYSFIGQHGVGVAPDAPFGYSNLGVGLLGQALADRAGKPYAKLLHEQITGPLQMADTGVALSAGMRAHFVEGHDSKGRPAHAWDLNALVGAGGIRSTAGDMLTYLEAQLHPDQLPPGALTGAGKTLPAAIAASHVVHAEATPGTHIALNWFHHDATGSYWHNGATGGYSSYAIFNPAKDFAVIVLSNTAAGEESFAEKLGEHIVHRLEGTPAISLAMQAQP